VTIAATALMAGAVAVVPGGTAGAATAVVTGGKAGAGVLSPRGGRLAQPSLARSSSATQAKALGLVTSGPGHLVRESDGRVEADLRMTDAGAAGQAALAAAGATVLATDAPWVTVAIAPADLEALAKVPQVVSATEVLAPAVSAMGTRLRTADATPAAVNCTTNPTGVVDEGDAQLEAALARSSDGVNGAGIKVGVLSDSYNRLGGASADVLSADLPGTGNPCGYTTPVDLVKELPAADTGSEDEGRAMLQIVHDLAPGAQLLFATGDISEVDMASEILALKAAGATVIVDDITYFDEPMYQDGPIAAAVDQVVAAGVSYFSSAANSTVTLGGHSIGSYEAPAFRPTTCPTAIAAFGETSCHDFDPTSLVDTGDAVTATANHLLAISLGWNEPMLGVKTDLDLFVVNASTGAIIDSSADFNITSGLPDEVIAFDTPTGNASNYKIVVGRAAGTADPRFKIIFYRAPFTSVQWNTSAGGDIVGPTMYGHNGALAAASLAAVPSDDSSTVEYYSSQGPATYCWKPESGSKAAAAMPCASKQPDFAATDGVSTTLPGDSGLNPFYGTSAAAPHAAAIVALERQKAPCRTEAQYLAAEADSGRAVGSSGPSSVGSGLIDAVAAVANVGVCVHTLANAPGAPSVTSATTTSVQLKWTAPANAVTVGVTGYRITVSSAGVSQPLRIVTSAGTGLTASVTGLATGQAYRFTVSAKNNGGYSLESGASAYTVPPFTTITKFIDQQFQDFAGRLPTSAELASWQTIVTNPASTGAASIATATGFSNWGPKVDPTIRLYNAFFGRLPDTGGLTFWAGQLRKGVSLNGVANSFAASNEFKTTYGSLSNAAFVNLVYENVLGRAGDAGGVSYWTSQLDTGKKTRGAVMTNFSESHENLVRMAPTVNVVDPYFGMLLRVPTTAELNAGLMISGTSSVPVITGLLATPEYLARLS
jgi:hypothetical protein